MHLVADDGNSNGLFHGAFMDSGSLFNMPSQASGQSAYNTVVNFTSCGGHTNTLECLRSAPYEVLVDAINHTRDLFQYSSLDNDWKPRIDNALWRKSSLCAVKQGLFANVPMIVGACDDEGTLFSLSSLNVSNNLEFLEYITTYYIEGVDEMIRKELEIAYPNNPVEGSPFGTGNNNAITHQFKRIAAFQGDLIFQGPRRHLLEYASERKPAWSSLNKRGKTTPVFGAVHASDISIWLGRNTTNFAATDYLIHFVYYLNPNDISDSQSDANALYWPQWNEGKYSQKILTFMDHSTLQILEDDFRYDSIALLNNLQLSQAESQGLC